VSQLLLQVIIVVAFLLDALNGPGVVDPPQSLSRIGMGHLGRHEADQESCRASGSGDLVAFLNFATVSGHHVSEFWSFYQF
jgi:hypothetical protein